jgi:hypothetical protein
MSFDGSWETNFVIFKSAVSAPFLGNRESRISQAVL